MSRDGLSVHENGTRSRLKVNALTELSDLPETEKTTRGSAEGTLE